jgi:GT2 family glycosyltransferase
MEVEQPAAACLMVRRSALDQISGFDEAFSPAWFEDVDLCKRIRNAGGRILLQPAARFPHLGGYSLNRLTYVKFLEHYHTNLIRYFYKNHGAREAHRVRGFIIAGLNLRAGVSIFRSLLKGSTRAESFRVFRAAARHFSASSEGTT